MNIDCCVGGRPNTDFIMYISSLTIEKINKFSKDDQDYLLETYKHLKNCGTCKGYYNFFKRAILAKDYNDYIKKFGRNCDKESFKNVKKSISIEQLRLLSQNERYLESMI